MEEKMFMKKISLVLFVMLFSMFGIKQIESPMACSAFAAPNSSVTADVFETNILTASKYVNQASSEMHQGNFPQAYTTLDEAFKYLDFAEKNLIANHDYKDRDNLLFKIKRSKATIYALKGKLEIESFSQINQGIANLKRALELEPDKGAETLLVYANVSLSNGHPYIASIYINQILESKNISKNYIEIAKNLKTRL